MNSVLVDSSIWIDYFKGIPASLPLNELMDSNRICTNELILSELLPAIIHKKEKHLEDLLNSVARLTMQLDWNHIRNMQTRNLKNGINNVGIADLIIAQNAIQNSVAIYSSDKHFAVMGKLHGIGILTK
jgi:predicted nucleic acid-binding protein